MDSLKYINTLITCGKLQVNENDMDRFKLRLSILDKCGIDIKRWIKLFISYEEFNGLELIYSIYKIRDYSVNNNIFKDILDNVLNIAETYNKLLDVRKSYRFTMNIINSIVNLNTNNYDKIINLIDSFRLVTVNNLTSIKLDNKTYVVNRAVLGEKAEYEGFVLYNEKEAYSKFVSMIIVESGNIEVNYDRLLDAEKEDIINKRLLKGNADLIILEHRKEKYEFINEIWNKIENQGLYRRTKKED